MKPYLLAALLSLVATGCATTPTRPRTIEERKAEIRENNFHRDADRREAHQELEYAVFLDALDNDSLVGFQRYVNDYSLATKEDYSSWWVEAKRAQMLAIARAKVTEAAMKRDWAAAQSNDTMNGYAEFVHSYYASKDCDVRIDETSIARSYSTGQRAAEYLSEYCRLRVRLVHEASQLVLNRHIDTTLVIVRAYEVSGDQEFVVGTLPDVHNTPILERRNLDDAWRYVAVEWKVAPIPKGMANVTLDDPDIRLGDDASVYQTGTPFAPQWRAWVSLPSFVDPSLSLFLRSSRKYRTESFPESGKLLFQTKLKGQKLQVKVNGRSVTVDVTKEEQGGASAK